MNEVKINMNQQQIELIKVILSYLKLNHISFIKTQNLFFPRLMDILFTRTSAKRSMRFESTYPSHQSPPLEKVSHLSSDKSNRVHLSPTAFPSIELESNLKRGECYFVRGAIKSPTSRENFLVILETVRALIN